MREFHCSPQIMPSLSDTLPKVWEEESVPVVICHYKTITTSQKLENLPNWKCLGDKTEFHFGARVKKGVLCFIHPFSAEEIDQIYNLYSIRGTSESYRVALSS